MKHSSGVDLSKPYELPGTPFPFSLVIEQRGLDTIHQAEALDVKQADMPDIPENSFDGSGYLLLRDYLRVHFFVCTTSVDQREWKWAYGTIPP